MDTPGGTKIVQHEEAAHERRNWVRLTFDCNDRCVFCLDAHTHDGTVRAREEIKQQILDGRRKGAERLILSGGEPTIHPDFVDFVRLGRLAGYRKVQTVTNGRMFAYGEFLRRSLDAGLGEITFSIHGPNAKIHDALVGTRGRKFEANADPYECGLPSEVKSGFRFGISFYLIAMLFILFDIEVIFLYPVAIQLDAFGTFALVETIVFIVLLMIAFVYVWRRGALEWK